MMSADSAVLPPALKKRAERTGWQLTCTSSGFMIKKGSYSRHYGELAAVARDLAKQPVQRRRNNG